MAKYTKLKNEMIQHMNLEAGMMLKITAFDVEKKDLFKFQIIRKDESFVDELVGSGSFTRDGELTFSMDDVKVKDLEVLINIVASIRAVPNLILEKWVIEIGNGWLDG